jgi:hypothetical protein
VVAAAKAVGLHDTIQQLPRKYRTMLQERGQGLGYHEFNNSELHLLALARKNYEVRAKHAARRHTDTLWNRHSGAKPPGAVPDFDALHAQWESRLSAARQRLRCLTKPKVRMPTACRAGFCMPAHLHAGAHACRRTCMPAHMHASAHACRRTCMPAHMLRRLRHAVCDAQCTEHGCTVHAARGVLRGARHPVHVEHALSTPAPRCRTLRSTAVPLRTWQSDRAARQSAGSRSCWTRCWTRRSSWSSGGRSRACVARCAALVAVRLHHAGGLLVVRCARALAP